MSKLPASPPHLSTSRLPYVPTDCSLRDLSPSLVEHNRVCGVVSGSGVCYSGDSVGSVAVYFCTDGYSLEGDTTRECLSSGLWNGSTPQCVQREGKYFFCLGSFLRLLWIQLPPKVASCFFKLSLV